MLLRLYHWPLPQPSLNLFQPRHLCLACSTIRWTFDGNYDWRPGCVSDVHSCWACVRPRRRRRTVTLSVCLVGLVSCELINIPGLSVSVIYFLITITPCLKLQVHLFPQPAVKLALGQRTLICIWPEVTQLWFHRPWPLLWVAGSFGANLGAIEVDSSTACIFLVLWVTFLWLSTRL